MFNSISKDLFNGTYPTSIWHMHFLSEFFVWGGGSKIHRGCSELRSEFTQSLFIFFLFDFRNGWNVDYIQT